MSKYEKAPIDFSGLHTVGLEERGGKVNTGNFATLYRKGSGLAGWLASLPHILAGDSFRHVLQAISSARRHRRGLVWALGGHVIKCGLAPVLIDVMRRGYVTAFALNGAAAIHDFEIALAGHTSEDVEAALPDGRFGVADETGSEMNRAICAGDQASLGIGEALGDWLNRASALKHGESSLLLQAYRQAIPVTVHVAIGTDTPHIHPAAHGAAIGSATHRDFRLFSAYLADLDRGGVYLNCGSAVVLPEVFLKAVSAVRNLGYPLTQFTTVNLDFWQHYRPRVNVIERPHATGHGALRGTGYSLTGHHELMLPLLAAALIETEA